MKPYSRKLVLILSVVAVSLTLVVFYLASRGFHATELLVAWGWQGSGPDRICILQVINPGTQKRSPIHANIENCRYQVVNIQEQPRLVGEQNDPKAIVVYAIISTGTLVLEETIPVEGIIETYRPLYPQFGDGGKIYFAGILHSATGVMQGRVQLLQLDSQTGDISSLTTFKEGMIDSPQLSPDGSFLIYSVYPELRTWRDCRSHCGSYYRLLNLETNVDIDLVSQVNHLGANPVYSHCNLQWSPDGRFIAFNIGCESESPQYIIIFNVETNEVVTVIKPVEETLPSRAGMTGWLSNDELVYGQHISVEGFEFQVFRYFVYSLSTDSSEEWVNLPLTYSNGSIPELWNINWTLDGKYLTGITNRSDGAPLLVMSTSPKESQVRYISPDTINERPLWAPSGDWIAYTSFGDLDAWYESRNTIKITDRAGEVILDTDVSNITAALNYAWLRP